MHDSPTLRVALESEGAAVPWPLFVCGTSTAFLSVGEFVTFKISFCSCRYCPKLTSLE